MARSKRVLAEADPNAEAQPAPKKAATGKGRFKENDAPQAIAEENNLAASTELPRIHWPKLTP